MREEFQSWTRQRSPRSSGLGLRWLAATGHEIGFQAMRRSPPLAYRRARPARIPTGKFAQIERQRDGARRKLFFAAASTTRRLSAQPSSILPVDASGLRSVTEPNGSLRTRATPTLLP